MTRYSIFISVEEYEHFLPTKFTHADSKLMHSTLTEKCDYALQHSLLLNLSPSDPKKPSEILAEIIKTVSGSEPGDSILFYFAGHGHYSEGQAYLILPNTVPDAFETTALSLADISKELRKPQRACYRIFDACHSGLDVRDDDGVLDTKAFIREITHDVSGWVTLAACREDQLSIGDPQIGHGIFTYYLCNYISSLDVNEHIYPELLKLRVADDVYSHSKKLGFSQNPTLNASISGNISLATRRADPSQKAEAIEQSKEDISARIVRLAQVPSIIENDYLFEILNLIVAECQKEFEKNNNFNFGLSIGEPIRADDIPSYMESDVVDFSKRQSLQPRHNLSRHEEEYEENTYFSAMSMLYPKKKRVSVSYYIGQKSEYPPSATIVSLKGDDRCTPDLEVLIYVIPLQMTACMLVSAFKKGWPPFGDEAKIVCQSYQLLKPGDTKERIKEVAPFAVKRTMDKLDTIITNRLNLLEREMKG
jgi:hypothetical protein